ncbi:hypothetical protein BDV18DRAFT_129379, partial [Aspergillus unguis]
MNQDHYNGGCSLPPLPVLESVVDTYFEYHYSPVETFLLESSFREDLAAGTLPTYLLLAVLAAGVPLSPEVYYEGKRIRAAEAYAEESWLLVKTEALAHPKLDVVETLGVLCRIKHRAGALSFAYKILSLLVKTSRALHMMAEPPSSLPFVQQEHRRRIAWIIFILDAILAGGKSRPTPEIQDGECTLQMPCDEETFRAGEWQGTLTINDLLADDSPGDEPLHGVCLLALLIMIYGKCKTYVHRDGLQDRFPPWRTDSGFAQIESLLDQAKLRLEIHNLREIEAYRNGIATARVEASYVLLARINLHQGQCLLRHPFFVRQILKRFESEPEAAAFTMYNLDTANQHARLLVDLINAQYEAGGFTNESTGYCYYMIVAGSILSLASHFELNRGQPADSLIHLKRCLVALERLGEMWPEAANEIDNLCAFHSRYASTFAASLDPPCTSKDTELTAEQALSDLLDPELVVTPLFEPMDPLLSFKFRPRWPSASESSGTNTAIVP